MDKPRIVFGMNSLFAVGQFLPEVLASVRRKGFEVIVVAPPPSAEADLPPVCYPGVTFRFVAIRREISPFSDLRALWRLWSLLKSIRPAISNMSTPKMALLGGLAARLAGVPHRLYTLRGLRYETTRSWKRFLLMACERVACACAHQVICASRSVRESAARDGIAPPDKLVLLGQRASEGITLDSENDGPVSTGELRRQLGIPQGAAVIGFVGRLTRDKGIRELAQCLQILLREGRQVRLLILGEFEPGDAVDAETAAWIRTSPDVHWLGFVPRPEPYYRLMDVFAFPTYREGLGKVLLEAAAAGTPVVSTNTTGVVDVVVDGLTGILVPPGDAAALARAVGRLLDDRELAAQMGRAARKLMEEHFDNTVYLTRLGRLLEAMAGSEPAGQEPAGMEPMRTVER